MPSIAKGYEWLVLPTIAIILIVLFSISLSFTHQIGTNQNVMNFLQYHMPMHMQNALRDSVYLLHFHF